MRTLCNARDRCAQIYYALEEYAEYCGANGLLPRSVRVQEYTPKAYHFWSVALSAYDLAQRGFARQVVEKVSPESGALYKKTVSQFNRIYNYLLGIPADSSGAGDVRSTLEAQKAGAVFGYSIGVLNMKVNAPARELWPIEGSIFPLFKQIDRSAPQVTGWEVRSESLRVSFEDSNWKAWTRDFDLELGTARQVDRVVLERAPGGEYRLLVWIRR